MASTSGSAMQLHAPYLVLTFRTSRIPHYPSVHSLHHNCPAVHRASVGSHCCVGRTRLRRAFCAISYRKKTKLRCCCCRRRYCVLCLHARRFAHRVMRCRVRCRVVFLKVPMASVSGLAITSLQVFNEKYRPYKGVRTLTKSGKNFQVRTG